MIYRDSITADGETVRANIYVLSTNAKAAGGIGAGVLAQTVLTVSMPPGERAKLASLPQRWIWRGGTYFIQGVIVPIVALGRVDHYEVTVMQSTGQG